MQHVIPIMEGSKTVQQKLRKIHPNLEPMVKAKLNKFLATQIIFSMRHT